MSDSLFQKITKSLGAQHIITDEEAKSVVDFYRIQCYRSGYENALKHDTVYTPGRLAYFAREYGTITYRCMYSLFGGLVDIGPCVQLPYPNCQFSLEQRQMAIDAFTEEYTHGYNAGVRDR